MADEYTKSLLELLEPTNLSLAQTEKTFGERLFEVLPSVEIAEPMTEESWIRASRVSHVCEREEVLAARFGVNRSETRGAGFEMHCGIGAEFHRWVQRTGAVLLVGKWRCEKCKKYFPSKGMERIPMPDGCPSCGNEGLRYVEREYKDPRTRLRGHADGFLRINPNDPDEDEHLEFKTRGPWIWRYRQEPYIEDIEQAQAYLYLTGLKRTRIVWVNKGGTGEDPKGWFKEWTYTRDDAIIEKLVRRCTSVFEGLKTGELPPKICVASDCEKAKACPLVQTCFYTVE